MAFAQALKQSRRDPVYLVHGGTDKTGRASWYFVEVDDVATRSFLRAIQNGNADLEAYGTILESGYGNEPPYSIIEYMRTHYGYTG